MRDENGRFLPGSTGNPNGRAKGVRNATTMAIEKLLDGEAENIGRKAIELALGGDIQALRLCLDRIVPPRKERACPPVDLPKINDTKDVLEAISRITELLASGELTPTEVSAFCGVLEQYRRHYEAEVIESRLTELEGKLSER
mgnify:CR=1 FL=1|tara:strand:+ start:737 stop:1165 length:429 start_codon:yes stop_codon:yes gene_type:complete